MSRTTWRLQYAFRDNSTCGIEGMWLRLKDGDDKSMLCAGCHLDI